MIPTVNIFAFKTMSTPALIRTTTQTVKHLVGMFVPSFILQLPNPIKAVATVILPITPFNLGLLVGIFALVYFFNPLGMATRFEATNSSDETCECALTRKRSWKAAMKTSYLIYFVSAFVVNHHFLSTTPVQSASIAQLIQMA